MRKTIKRILAVSLTVATTLSLCGCSKVIGDDVTKYPLVESMTTQEVMDYYAESLKYDAVITRTTDVHEEQYALRPVSEAKAESVRTALSQAEQILGSDEYPEGADKLVTEDVYKYIKSTLDGLVLNNPQIGEVQQALGFYFVDVTYDISPKSAGTFTQMTPYIGINGAFSENSLGEYFVNSSFMKTAEKKLNEYFADNKIANKVTFDNTTGELKLEEGEIPTKAEYNSETTGIQLDTNDTHVDANGVDFSNDNSDEYADAMEDANTGDTFGEPDLEGETAEVTGAEGTEGSESTEETPEDSTETNSEAEEGNTEGEVENGEAVEGEETSLEDELNVQQTDSGVTYQSVVSQERKPQISVKLINRVVGSSREHTAFMPSLDLVYNKPEKEGVISGYGIYPEGENGLRIFGFDRSKLGGTATLRYIFKESVAGTGEIVGYNIYVSDIDVSTGFSTIENNVLIPDFLKGQLDQLVERADRINVDYDLSGYMEGNIYEDMGFGVLRGLSEECTNRLLNMSVIRSVLSRDPVNNAYLIETESTVQEGAKSSDVYGTYRDKYYLVIQQQGDEFAIIDSLRTSRQVYKEPSINPDSVIQKRLIALNLSGDISEDTRADISKLMEDFYYAGTVKLISGPKELEINGEKKTVERGLNDCLNSDVEMLSTSNKEYLLSEIKNQLSRFGTGTDSEYMGAVTQWIGGYDNQAEITTEEFIEYSGKGEGIYMECYYLVSKMHDTWVIDERRVINSETYTGAEVDNIRSRFEK